MQMFSSHNCIKESNGEAGFMDRKETSAEKHRRLTSQAREIKDYAETYGTLAAMDRYDFKIPQTLLKIIDHKEGKSAQLPLIDKRFMYNNPQDYYDGFVQATINRILALQAENSEKDRVIFDLRKQLEDLQGELHHRSSLESIRMEKKFGQLVRLVQEK